MGLSFGEIVVLAIVALVVIGPKDLPKVLRWAGQIIGQAKRALSDVRKETGLDEVLRGDFRDLERLADHLDGMEPAKRPALAHVSDADRVREIRERENPLIGPDAHGLLPEDAAVYGDLAPGVAPVANAANAADKPAEATTSEAPEPEKAAVAS